MKKPRLLPIALCVLALGMPCVAAVLDVGSGQPYTQIQAALNAANPGDDVRVHAGTYTELLSIYDHNLTLENFAGDAPVIVGRIDVGSYTNVTIRGMEITGWAGPYHAVYQDGGAALTLTHCKIHDCTAAGSASGIYSRHSPKLVVDDNDIYHCQKGVNIVSSYSPDGTYAGGAMVRGNKIHDNWVDGIDLHGEYITIRDNQIYNNINTNWVEEHPDGIQLIAAPVDGYTSVVHCIIMNNVIRNHTQNIFTEGTLADENSNCRDILIYNNVLYNETGTVNGVNMDALSCTHLMIKYSRDVYVYNNTLGRSGGTVAHVQLCANGSIFMKNNVFANDKNSGVYVEDPADISPGSLDYNLYNMATQPITWGSVFYSSRLIFSIATGQEVHGRDGNPLLGTWPLTLLGGLSPCLNNGCALGSQFATDVAGVSRPQGSGWDIGAYETVEAPLPPTNLHILP